jgi:uncharacterized protein YgiM (DUF1202 family)
MAYPYPGYLIRRVLVLLCFCVAISPQFSYASNLKEAPTYNSLTVAKLSAGEQVQIIEFNDKGWCKVRSVRTNLEGWVREEYLVDSHEVVSPPTHSDEEGTNAKPRKKSARREKARERVIPVPDAM